MLEEEKRRFYGWIGIIETAEDSGIYYTNVGASLTYSRTYNT